MVLEWLLRQQKCKTVMFPLPLFLPQLVLLSPFWHLQNKLSFRKCFPASVTPPGLCFALEEQPFPPQASLCCAGQMLKPAKPTAVLGSAVPREEKQSFAQSSELAAGVRGWFYPQLLTKSTTAQKHHSVLWMAALRKTRTLKRTKIDHSAGLFFYFRNHLFKSAMAHLANL